jgi:hypothetical protein
MSDNQWCVPCQQLPVATRPQTASWAHTGTDPRGYLLLLCSRSAFQSKAGARCKAAVQQCTSEVPLPLPELRSPTPTLHCPVLSRVHCCQTHVLLPQQPPPLPPRQQQVPWRVDGWHCCCCCRWRRRHNPQAPAHQTTKQEPSACFFLQYQLMI